MRLASETLRKELMAVEALSNLILPPPPTDYIRQNRDSAAALGKVSLNSHSQKSRVQVTVSELPF